MLKTYFLVAAVTSGNDANKLLENFDKTDLSWWLFLAGGSAAFIITLMMLYKRTFRGEEVSRTKTMG